MAGKDKCSRCNSSGTFPRVAGTSLRRINVCLAVVSPIEIYFYFSLETVEIEIYLYFPLETVEIVNVGWLAITHRFSSKQRKI